MKKINRILFSMICMTLSALAGTSGVLTYEVLYGTEIRITDCSTSASGTVTIPATLEGKPVTLIGYQAFMNCSGITTIDIPENVKNIDGLAFYNCSGLTSVAFPTSLAEYLGVQAFKNCTNLKRAIFKGDAPTSVGSNIFDNTASSFKIYYADNASGFSNPWNGYSAASFDYRFSFDIQPGTPETIKITDYPLSLGSTEIDVPSTIIGLSVTCIGVATFDGQMLATRIDLPDSITRIERGAFYECTGLTTFTIPSSVTFIGDYAFEDAYHLDSLFFKGNAPQRGGDIFSGRTPKIHYLPENAQGFEDDDYPWANIETYTALYDFEIIDETIKITNYPNTETGELTIPNTIVGKPVTRIGEAAFYGCDQLTRISLPDGLISIYREAFELCSGLTTLTIPNTVTSIGDRAYSACTLDSVFFEGNAPSMGSTSLGSATGLIVYYRDGNTDFTSPWNGYTTDAYTGPLSFTVTEEVVSITDCLTSASGDLITPVRIVGKPVVAFEELAFYQCNSLTRISIPSTVTTIADNALRGIKAVTEYSVARENPVYSSLDGVLFNKTQTQLLSYPQGKEGDYVVPDTVALITSQSFSMCKKIYSIVIPESVTTIEWIAFNYCEGLTAAVFRGNAPAMASTVFEHVSSSFKSYYPDNKTGFSSPIWSGYPAESFDGKFSFDIHSRWVGYPSSLEQTLEITDYPETEIGALIIPQTFIDLPITIIGENAFESCIHLTSITLPGNLITTGNSAFTDCQGLTFITIPDQVTSIGDFSFYNCTNLKTVIFEGDAPVLEESVYSSGFSFTMYTSVFDETDPDFMIYYFSDHTASGFSSPLWEGYPATEINLNTRPLAMWLIEYGIVPDADISDDLNGDGVSLLMNYALNLDPTQNQAGNTPQLDFDNPQPGVISIYYYATQADVTYTVDTSTDLETWTTNGVTLTPFNGNYRAAWVPQTGTHQFLRLRVEAAAP